MMEALLLRIEAAALALAAWAHERWRKLRVRRALFKRGDAVRILCTPDCAERHAGVWYVYSYDADDDAFTLYRDRNDIDRRWPEGERQWAKTAAVRRACACPECVR